MSFLRKRRSDGLAAALFLALPLILYAQVTIGGRQGNQAAIGRIIGPSFARAEVPDVIERLLRAYLSLRDSDAERFVLTGGEQIPAHLLQGQDGPP